MRHTILGKDGKDREVDLTPLKAIRQKCLECSGWVAPEVRRCEITNCALYPYRMGSNPERKGIGGRKHHKIASFTSVTPTQVAI